MRENVKSTKSLAQQGIATGGDVSGETVVQTVITNAAPNPSNKLSRLERRSLHARVERTAITCKIEPKDLWITLHHLARVDSVEDMVGSHLPALNIVLDLMDENAALRDKNTALQDKNTALQKLLPDDELALMLLDVYQKFSVEEQEILWGTVEQVVVSKHNISDQSEVSPDAAWKMVNAFVRPDGKLKKGAA
jgi:hypothetical protein